MDSRRLAAVAAGRVRPYRQSLTYRVDFAQTVQLFFLMETLSEFVFSNIHIHICFENMETDMVRALSDPHLIRFHPK
jgi:hypothetical protein